jgi:glucokinase
MGPTYLAVDIGGTKLACGIVDDEGTLLHRFQAPTPRSEDPEVVFGALEVLAHEALGASPTRPVSCGVGCGGPMCRGGMQESPLNIPAWREFPLAGRLGDLVGLPVVVDNDAKALALGEGWMGAALGSTSYMAMVVSTGVGGGIVLDGRLLDGRLGNAGHIGHLVVVPGGRRCRCGVDGCLEAEASGTAIEAITGRHPSEAPREIRVRCGELVGRAVASAVTLLDLDLCVVAGSVALGFGADFFDAAQAALDAVVGLSYARGARIVPAGLGDAGPLVGAGALARELHAHGVRA